MHVKGELDTDRLYNSINLVVKKHSILRTSYLKLPEFALPFQSIETHKDFSFSYFDNSNESLSIADFKNGNTAMPVVLRNYDFQNEAPLTVKLIRYRSDNYVLIISLPSIAADSYSLKNLVEEISRAYAKSDTYDTEGGVQYFHFSEWHNSLLENGNEEAVDFWSKYKYLPDNDAVISFSKSLSPTNLGKFNFSSKKLTIDSELFTGVKMLAENLKASVSDILLACFTLLMTQHTRKEKITVGYVNNNRPYEELQPVIGPIAQTLPLNVEFNTDYSFSGLVKIFQEEIEKVLDREDYFTWGASFNDYLNNANPYFKLEFEYNSITTTINKFNDIEFSIAEITSVSNSFDLKLACLDFADSLQMDFYHNQTLLTGAAIEVIARQYQTLLQTFINHPQSSINTLISADKYEYQVITSVFNQTQQVEISGSTAVEVFEKTVRENPAVIAIKYEGIELTFKELNEKANQVAHYLIDNCAVKPKDTVALLMPRSEKLIISMLGILKAGACYLPVDNGFPAERIRLMIESSGAKAIIGQKVLPEIAIQQIIYQQVVNTVELADKANLNIEIKPDDAVYIIYTSGSTGIPKGVAISNKSLINYTTWFLNKSNLKPQSSTLLLSSIAFDVSYTSLWTSLMFGHTLCLLKETDYIESADIIQKLIEYKIDYIKLTPSHFNIILNDPDFENKIFDFNLSLIVIGGEEINVDDVEAYFKLRNDVRILHHYGPTETTVGTLALMIKYDDINTFKEKVVLGQPITNSCIYIINSKKELCPIGFTGEIAVSGKGVALGYVNNLDITNEKFVANPIDNNSLLYLTGDLGRWMPNGTVQFLGRKDNQVKVRGYRIELGEIENALIKNNKIKAAIVLPDKKANGDIKLIAYLQADSRQNNEQMTVFLSKSLPAYMIPDIFVWLDKFPLTQNGKTDKKALAAIELTDESQFSYQAPKTLLEKKMVLIWKDVLLKEKIGVTDDFFKLGGHSLKATQLISRIFKNMEFRIKLSDVFENPTIKSLINVITESGQIKYEAIEKIQEQEYYDVSHAQKRLWFLDQFKENQSAYNIHYAYWIKGEININALKKALESVIRRHETLRTVFVVIDGLPKQKINKYEDCNFELEYIDLRNEPDAATIAEDVSKECLGHTFSLKNGPVLKTTLVQTESDTYAFFLTMHHIVSDGWSMRVLMNEIMLIYNLYCNGDIKQEPLEPLVIQYKDYALWHNKMITLNERTYWHQKLSNPPDLVNLPYDKKSVAETQVDEAYLLCELDRETTLTLRKLAKTYNSTLSNIILTIYALFVNKISGKYDFLIGVGHANRNHADVENIIGFFVNLLAIRIQFTDDSSIEDIIKEITKSSIEAYDHSNYPIDLLVEKFCNERYSNRQPLLNIMYDYKSYSDLMIENEGFIDSSVLEISEMPRLRNIAKFDITLFVSEIGDDLRYSFEYDNSRFSESTINNFYKIFNELIKLLVQHSSIETSSQVLAI